MNDTDDKNNWAMLILIPIFGFLLYFFLCWQVLGAERDSLIEIPTNVKSNSIQSMTFLKNKVINDRETIAMAVYPLSTNANAWDDLNYFGEEFDKRFFSGLSRKAMAGGGIAALFGGIVPHPSCGYIINSIGDFLRIPVREVESDLLIAWITITTTPVFIQQGFNMGRRILTTVLKETAFDPDKQSRQVVNNVADSEKINVSTPRFFKKTKAHYAAKGFMFISSAVNASIPFVLMKEAEKNNVVFFGVTAAPFYLAWLDIYYRIGVHNIDHLFEFYRYSARTNYQKREILHRKITGFKNTINNNDNIALHVYNVIFHQKENNFKAVDGNPFAFSALFLTNLLRMSTEDAGLLMNYKIDVDSNPISLTDNMLEWISPFITGASLYPRYCINQYLLDLLLIELGAASNDAFIISTTFATFETLYRLLISNHLQEANLKSMKDSFSLHGNFPFLRKGLGLASVINGALFSLPNLVAGLKVFHASSMLSQVAYLAPTFVSDFVLHNSFFNHNYNEFVTNLSAIKSNNLSVMGKRAHLNFYANKAYRYIHKFDAETIEQLYQIIQKGV